MKIYKTCTRCDRRTIGGRTWMHVTVKRTILLCEACFLSLCHKALALLPVKNQLALIEAHVKKEDWTKCGLDAAAFAARRKTRVRRDNSGD